MENVNLIFSRCFIALRLEAEETKQLFEQLSVFREQHSLWRWLPVASLHLTLRFLGPCRKSQYEHLCDTLEGQLSGVMPFSGQITALVPFPTQWHPQVLALQMADNDVLMDCFKRVEFACQEVGFQQVKRPFRPHITVARLKSRQTEEFAEFHFPQAFDFSCHFQVLEVLDSTGSKEGDASYSSLYKIDLTQVS